jgi:hypothetical protein
MRLERFNRTALIDQRTLNDLDPVKVEQEAIKNTPGLLRASLKDAALYGGPVVQQCLSTLQLAGNRKYITVDVKTHMLMQGMIPAIPGWHTDGVPRQETGEPFGPLAPDLKRQEDFISPCYHLMYVGCDAPTVFVTDLDVSLNVPDGPDPELYAQVTKEMNNCLRVGAIKTAELPEGVWWTWDWWQLHSAQPSREAGWHCLIRVTESDYLPPLTDLRDIIRTQQQAYIQGEYGW